MIKLEVAVSSDQVEKVTEAIIRAATTGEIGDGRIFVLDLDRAVRISTGATDEMTFGKAIPAKSPPPVIMQVAEVWVEEGGLKE